MALPGIYRGLASALIGLGLVFVLGCSSPARISYIPEGGSYTAADLPEALSEVDLGPSTDLPPDEIAAARQEALADLRTYGEDAATLADALTAQFPVDVNAVPLEVRLGAYEGQPAWIVVESWGDTGESLTRSRLWVFSAEDLMLLTALSGQ